MDPIKSSWVVPQVHSQEVVISMSELHIVIQEDTGARHHHHNIDQLKE